MSLFFLVNEAFRALAEKDVTHTETDHIIEWNPQDGQSWYSWLGRKKFQIISMAHIRNKQFDLFRNILVVFSLSLTIGWQGTIVDTDGVYKDFYYFT